MDSYINVKIFFVCIILCNYHGKISGHKQATVSSKAGTFSGIIRELDVFGKPREVQKYLGIPYAEAPTGKRRFEKPVLKGTTTALYDATKYGASCMQLTVPWGGVRNPKANIENFSEDCLFLNIHKPVIESQSNLLPVFVFIHGGGFVFASSEIFDGDWLSAYGEVIVITMNYRLNVWGFLSSGDKGKPANFGLWDQHIALKWINQNIEAFGGDPDWVTISGQSAGGSSVVYQALFPGNKGLFNRVIALAGSITCPWSYNLRPRDTVLRFGNVLGCDTNLDIDNIIHCIKSKSTEELDFALNNPTNIFRRFPMEFVTTIDGEFLKEHPRDMIKPGSKVSRESHEFFATLDFMTGITSFEGGMMVFAFVGVDNSEDYITSRREFENEIVPTVAKLVYGNKASKVIADMIKHEYTFWDSPNDLVSVRRAFIDMSSDYVFDIHAKIIADLHANVRTETQTYAYILDENPSQSIIDKPSWLQTIVHGDDQTFLFGYDKEGFLKWTSPYKEKYTPEDWEIAVSKLFMKLLTNFAKSGNPNVHPDTELSFNINWPVYESVSGKYLNITRHSSNKAVQGGFCAKEYNFWDVLIPSVIDAAKHVDDGSSCVSVDDQTKYSSEDHCDT